MQYIIGVNSTMSENFITVAIDLENKRSLITHQVAFKTYDDFIGYYNAVKKKYNQICFCIARDGVITDVLFNYSDISSVNDMLTSLREEDDLKNKYDVKFDGKSVKLKTKENISDKILNEGFFTAINKYEMIAIKEYFDTSDDLIKLYEDNNLFHIKLSSLIDYNKINEYDLVNNAILDDTYLVSKRTLNLLKEESNKRFKNDFIRRKNIENLLDINTFEVSVVNNEKST